MKFFRSVPVRGALAWGARPILTAPVRWYFCAAGAELMPFPTAFGSIDWCTPEEKYESDIGEVPGSSAWSPGKRPANALGKTLCGKAENWQNGFDPLARRVPVAVGLSGLPLCCGHVPAPADTRLGFNALRIADLTKRIRWQGAALPRGGIGWTGRRSVNGIAWKASDTNCCPGHVIGPTMRIMHLAPGLPWDGSVFECVLLPLDPMLFRVWSFVSTGAVDLEAAVADTDLPGAMTWSFTYEVVATGDFYSADNEMPVSCAPFGFDDESSVFLNGIDTGLTTRIVYLSP